MTAKKVSTWLITGASSGIGKSLALAALQAGHKVIGATRDAIRAGKSCPEFAKDGGLWITLDPARKDAYDQFVKVSQDHDVDVLVNNAGYAFIGAIEDTEEQEVRDQMEVNFYGPLRAVRGCLPSMRARGGGNIVIISSGAGFISRPGRATYSASKFAIEAIHEALAYELSTFNIKVLIVEPGAFRTSFSDRIVMPARYSDGFSEIYRGTAVEEMSNLSRNLATMPDLVRGDPDKAATAVIDAVENGHEYLRLVLGKDCVHALELKISQLTKDLEATRVVALSTEIN